MKVRVILSAIVDTQKQDQFLKEALENLASGGFKTLEDVEQARKLITDTFKVRFSMADLGIRRVWRDPLKIQ